MRQPPLLAATADSTFLVPSLLCGCAGLFGDIPIGLYIVRGDSVVLLGEIDPEKEANLEGLTRVSAEVRPGITHCPFRFFLVFGKKKNSPGYRSPVRLAWVLGLG